MRRLTFAELSTHDLYAVLRLRSAVFVVEQDCVYQDIDGLDEGAHHLLMERDGAVIGYARLLAPGVKYDEPCIGRVVLDASHRGDGLGRRLMEKAISEMEMLYPGTGIRIEAQAYLSVFYKALGFEPVGETYMLDGIPHIEMLRL